MFGREPRFNGYALLTFVIGALAGAAIALLYAPASGKKLQRQLKDAWEDQVDNVQDVVKKIVR
jgi:gas vesicle protein